MSFEKSGLKEAFRNAYDAGRKTMQESFVPALHAIMGDTPQQAYENLNVRAVQILDETFPKEDLDAEKSFILLGFSDTGHADIPADVVALQQEAIAVNEGEKDFFSMSERLSLCLKAYVLAYTEYYTKPECREAHTEQKKDHLKMQRGMMEMFSKIHPKNALDERFEKFYGKAEAVLNQGGLSVKPDMK
ncbi:MAG: hypothetical protein H6867_07330 [Rhodospirillales bacterium]|nr:hypothetical protein [Rhodospirillales bacterium]MCB9995363.1 hypothetical protein [Rhodospirillales bacterium]